MTRRRLTPDEIDLWHRAIEQTDRLHPPTDAPVRPVPRPKPKPVKQPLPRVEPFLLGQSTREMPTRLDLKPSLQDRLGADALRINRKTFARMKRGKLTPQARIDLHGQRLETAHGLLVRFILSSQASGRRLVLVITGKGKPAPDVGPIPTPRGVLRHQVPDWLALPPLAQAVLQVVPAHVSHGGGGAYYVYLRR